MIYEYRWGRDDHLQLFNIYEIGKWIENSDERDL